MRSPLFRFAPSLQLLLVCSMLSRPLLAAPQTCDFEPQVREVILNTDFTQVVCKAGPPFNVAGGVFLFRSVHIPQGVTVRGTGSRPMIWVVTGDVVIDGELTLSGGNGERVDTLNSANFPARGGVGVCGGGNGGRGSPSTTSTSPTGEAGYGPWQVPGGGGQGGAISCTVPACRRGSGGGGGAFATQGDPHYPLKGFIQQLGIGGFGSVGIPVLLGGMSGPPVFGDGRAENDFFGLGVDLHRRIFISGELTMPIGGQGGGGGGDESTLCTNNPLWYLDAKGGGGGGGGGVLGVFTVGAIRVGATGVIRCDGGHGGGGEVAGTSSNGGGGGAGAGGLVILYTLKEIELAVHGETYARGDSSFAISADGGVGLRGSFQTVPIAGKYPAPATALVDGTGGMGGMGLVQLMVPPGSNGDGTNTVLDDNVHVVRGGSRLTGSEKQRYLAWRGYPQPSGVAFDDFGKFVWVGDAEGDIRPAPILIPVLR